MHEIKGTPKLSTLTLIDLVKQREDCEFLSAVSADETGATWEAKRKGDPSACRVAYTTAEAYRDGRIRPGSAWERHPGNLCSMVAARKLIALVWPEVDQ